MRIRSLVNTRWVLIATVFPLVVLGLFILGVKIEGLVRYDPAYFTAPYLERYDAPGPTALALEQALKTDDQELLAELQGVQRPASFETSPRMTFIMLWEVKEPYISYLYLDMTTLWRYTHYVEEVEGRWVVAPTDARYFLRSGRWATVFMPIAITWWLVELVVVLAVVVYRLSARLREERWPPGA